MTLRKINRLTALLLIVGCGAALVIYLTAAPEPDDPSLNDPLATKKLNHELRVLGGEANVFAAELQDWFASLWHGRHLAGTVIGLTVGTTLAFRFVAVRSDHAATSVTKNHPPN